MSWGSGGIQGSIENLLATWWGFTGGVGAYSGFPYDFTINPMAAANLVFGCNPLYQITDFLNTYPKFGTWDQGLALVVPDIVPGLGYDVGDILNVLAIDASGGQVLVTAVDPSGVPLSYSIQTEGEGYQIVNALVTTGGIGTGALVDVTMLDAPNLQVPQAVLQMYINLASACLSKSRWFEYWYPAIGWFVAHYVTLYLRSEGNPGSTAGQIAASGLTRGIMVSKGAGNVQAMIEVPKGLEEWAAFTSTEYGVQLATVAKVIGMGAMYIM